jgi:hypothetical protein
MQNAIFWLKNVGIRAERSSLGYFLELRSGHAFLDIAFRHQRFIEWLPVP